MEEMVGGDEVAHLIPAQLQWWVRVVLDHVDRVFRGSLMEALKVRRMSGSDGIAEVRRKGEKKRRRRRRGVGVAIFVG